MAPSQSCLCILLLVLGFDRQLPLGVRHHRAVGDPSRWRFGCHSSTTSPQYQGPVLNRPAVPKWSARLADALHGRLADQPYVCL